MSRARDLSRLSNQTNFTTDVATGRVGLGSEIPTAKLNVTGIVSATAFYGDGSNLEGVASSGLGTALADDGIGSVIYYNDKILEIDTNTTVDVPDTSDSNVAYTQYAEVSVDSGIDLIIADGDDFVPDILGISSDVQVPGVLAGSGGRVRADNFSNKAGTGAPNFPSGLTGTTGSFTGNVSVGGVLTYEDVTNIDSVGIVTARTGVRITDGGLIVTAGVSTFAADISIADKIIHTDDTDTAIRFPAADTFTVETAGSERLRVDSTGDVRFAGTNLTNNTNKSVNLTVPSYNTSEEDVNLIQVENESGSNQITFGGGTSALNAATTLRFLTASAVNTTTGTERLRITSGGAVLINSTSASTSDTFLELKNTAAHTELNIISKNDSGALINFGDTDSYNRGRVKYNNADNSLSFRTDGTDRLTLTGTVATFSSNNVFIGEWADNSNAAIYVDISGNRGVIYSKGDGNSLNLAFAAYAGGYSGSDRTFGVTGNGNVICGVPDVSSTTAYGVQTTIAANAGDVIAQCTQAASQYTELFRAYKGTTKVFSVVANGALSITGALSKGSGSFKIDHPLPAKTGTHHLVHSFIEGPQADLIYRGYVDLVDGQATVNIDTAGRMTEGTFEVLCTNVSCFTSNESDWTAVKGSVTGNVLTINAQDATSTSKVSWMVVGERKDDHMIDTGWTDSNGRVITEPLKDG